MKGGCAKSILRRDFRPIKLQPLLGATRNAFMKSSETSEYQQEAAQRRFKQTHGGQSGKNLGQDGSILIARNENCATRQLDVRGFLVRKTRCTESAVRKRRTGRAAQPQNVRLCIPLQNGRRLSNTSMRETDTHVNGAELGITDQTSYTHTTSNHGQNTGNYDPIRTT